jgi:hypothetical protein
VLLRSETVFNSCLTTPHEALIIWSIRVLKRKSTQSVNCIIFGIRAQQDFIILLSVRQGPNSYRRVKLAAHPAYQINLLDMMPKYFQIFLNLCNWVTTYHLTKCRHAHLITSRVWRQKINRLVMLPSYEKEKISYMRTSRNFLQNEFNLTISWNCPQI